MGYPPRVDAVKLREMLDTGKTDAQIAQAMGVHYITVGQHRRRLGIACNGPQKVAWTVPDRVRLMQMHIAGVPIERIAAKLRRSISAVHHECAKNGLLRTAPRATITPKLVQRAREMRSRGMTYAEIGSRLGCDRVTIMRRLTGDKRKKR